MSRSHSSSVAVAAGLGTANTVVADAITVAAAGAIGAIR